MAAQQTLLQRSLTVEKGNQSGNKRYPENDLVEDHCGNEITQD